MNKKTEDTDYDCNFETETLSLHSIHHSFHEEKVSENSTKNKSHNNKSLILSQNKPVDFRISNDFKRILKNLEGIRLPQQAKELRSISKDFLRDLDKYLDKKKVNLLVLKKEKNQLNNLTINRELENNKKTIATLNKEYKQLTKTMLKVNQNQYKNFLEKEKKALDNKIELCKREINNMKLEENKRGSRITEYEKISREIVDLEDQIGLQKKKAAELEQKTLDVELNQEKTSEAIGKANENLQKIDGVAKFYQVKMTSPSKELENLHQNLSFKMKYLETRMNKLKEEVPLKSIYMEIKALKKKNNLLKKILAFQTKDFHELLQKLLLNNRSLSNCIEDSIKIPFVEEQLKKMGVSTNQSFYIPSKKSFHEKMAIDNPIQQNLLNMEKDATILHEKVETQINELEKIVVENIEKNTYDFKKPIETETVLKNNDKMEIIENHQIIEKTENIILNDKSYELTEEKINKDIINEEGKDQTISSLNIKEPLKEETVTILGNPPNNQKIIENNERLTNESNLKDPIDEPEIKAEPPKRSFNFSRNKDYSSLFKDYETPKAHEEIPMKNVDNNSDFFKVVLNTETNDNKTSARVIKDPSSMEDLTKSRIRKIMDPNLEQNDSLKNKNAENKTWNMPTSFKSSQKKSNNVFDGEVNYFPELNL